MSEINHIKYMNLAIKQAKKALSHDDIPIGAIVVKNEEVIGRGENRREIENDPTAHAEVIAIKKAAAHLKTWQLDDCSLYVTLEPCAMCAGTICNAHIKEIYFGAFDKDDGYASSRLNLIYLLNKNATVIGGIKNEECANLIKDFFKTMRENKKTPRLY